MTAMNMNRHLEVETKDISILWDRNGPTTETMLDIAHVLARNQWYFDRNEELLFDGYTKGLPLEIQQLCYTYFQLMDMKQCYGENYENEWIWTRREQWPGERSNKAYSNYLIVKSLYKVLMDTLDSFGLKLMQDVRRCILVQCVAKSEWAFYEIQDTWYTFDIWWLMDDNECIVARFHKYRHQEDTS